MHSSRPTLAPARYLYFLALFVASCFIASCASQGDNPAAAVDSDPLSRQGESPFASTERVIVEQINQHRITVGLPALKLDETIGTAARKHSQEMASQKIPLSHKGFSQRIEAIEKVMPVDDATENISYSFSTDGPVSFLLYSWLNNPLMKNNIEGRYDYTGVGVAQAGPNEYYVTQIFVRRK
jgi:uncharacterized protein YkwD